MPLTASLFATPYPLALSLRELENIPRRQSVKVIKAIELLELNIPKGKSEMPADIKEALQLGIEALKKHRDHDYRTYAQFNNPLPGETP